MKKVMTFGLFIISIIFLVSCSSKKSEDDYYKLAYDQYNDGKYEESIKNFNSILEYYADGENAANSMFMIGFIYANHISDYDNAKEYYSNFLQKYPEHELASSAKYELDTLGKDINELDIFKNIENEEQAETK